MNVSNNIVKTLKIILTVLGFFMLAKIVFTFIYFVAIALSIISSNNKHQTFSSLQDTSGYKQFYHLPDGSAFTIWEKEPGKYGSEVLIIPGEYKNKKTPNISHIKTKFGSHTTTLLYHLVERYSNDESIEKNKIFLKIDSGNDTLNENLYEIMNIKKSSWEISIYSDNRYNDFYICDSNNSQLRYDISLISIDLDDHYIDYHINHWLNYNASY